MTKTLLDPEGYCPANDHPRWNQSFFFNLYDPRTRVGCFIRIGVLENLQQTNNWFIFFRDGKPLYTRHNMNLPYTNARMDKGMEVAGVRITAIQPMRTARVEFSETDFSVDLLWESTHDMEDCIAMSKDQDGSFAREIANVHMEGPCRVRGVIMLRGGERIDINGNGFRDLSYGPRNWDILRHYRLAWPVFDNGPAVVAVHGISTTGQNTYMKMMHDGAEWLAITKIVDHNEYADDEMTLRSMHWKIWDSRDRLWEFTAKPIFRWFFPFDTFVLAEHMMEYRLQEGTVGYGMAECGYRFPWAGNGN